MMNNNDINALESLKYFEDMERREYEAQVEYNRLCMTPNERKYEEFKQEMLKYDNFSEEELREMFEAEMLVENDI